MERSSPQPPPRLHVPGPWQLAIAGLLMCRSGWPAWRQLWGLSAGQAAAFFVHAFLYVFTNNLRYFIVRAVNPGLIGVMWNLKIVLVALLYQLPPFSRPLAPRQWGGAALLVVGRCAAAALSPPDAGCA